MRLAYVLPLLLLPHLPISVSAAECELLSLSGGDDGPGHRRLSDGGYASFDGISLESKPGEVVMAARRRGLEPEVITYVGSPEAVSAVHIWADYKDVGIVDYGRNGRPIRISLGVRYFCSAPVSTREFADTLFQIYAVKTDEVDDDNCFQDVTCFRGHTRKGEQFMILKLSDEPELYVRRDPAE
jgi:hypothetical protein